jgi:hypothetical protein
MVVPMFHANSWGLAFAAPMAGARLVLPGGVLPGGGMGGGGGGKGGPVQGEWCIAEAGARSARQR